MSKKKKVQRATRATIGAERYHLLKIWRGFLQIDSGFDVLWTAPYSSSREAIRDVRKICAALGLKVVKELP